MASAIAGPDPSSQAAGVLARLYNSMGSSIDAKDGDSTFLVAGARVGNSIVPVGDV